MTDYAIRVGDRVKTKWYGEGVVVAVDTAGSENIYWIKLDSPPLAGTVP